MAFRSSAPQSASRVSARPLKALRRFAFDDNEQRVDCGSAVVVALDAAEQACLSASAAEGDEWDWSDEQTADFLAGGPISLGWVAPSPDPRGEGQVYVCCWITVGD